MENTSQPPKLKLYYGGGDLLEAIDDLRARVVNGEIEGLVIAAATKDMMCGWTWAWHDDMVAAWARMLAAVISAQHELTGHGLDGSPDPDSI